jgi:hypothetical protein
VLDGSVRIDAGGSSTTVAKDQAAFLGPTAKLSSSDASARFYLFTASATTTRTAVSPFAGAQIFYATDDLPSLPVMNQDEALVETTIQQGGSSPATRPNGVQVMIDLASAMDLSGGGTDIHRINAGDGRFVLQGSFVQLINRGDGAARYLSFYLLPHGLPLTVKAG